MLSEIDELGQGYGSVSLSSNGGGASYHAGCARFVKANETRWPWKWLT
jgi:hypothetical protein